ncbi:A/G-specific adenine glycosylase [Sphingomonas sp.]|uniref:A/G-specific adenine glycosylase n=1 Tax=Sphingomonas sp. TaxID=28214 RepID=UPI0025DEE35C|nr:A/G-specific adenine glycosylase [Sphingomonas sp.]
MPISAKLLRWYDIHARDLPWRSPPNSAPPDAYRVWLSEIMLQQTTVGAVRPYFAKFTDRWPTVTGLAAAEEADVMTAWAGLGYYARARNLLACARAVVGRHAGQFPSTEPELRALPGIGAYTSAAIAAIAFHRRAVVVDGNVERVVSRLFTVETPLPASRPELRRLTDTITPAARAGDFAQALMDLGSTICTPRNPSCLLCPLQAGCRATGKDPASYPRRAAKIAKPERTATTWWIECDGTVLLVRRPSSGLLGGMRALPSTLDPQSVVFEPPFLGEPIGGIVHVFTHFRLSLAIQAARLESGCNLPTDGEWWPIERLDEAGLPSVFAKVAATVLRKRNAMIDADSKTRLGSGAVAHR